MKKFILCLLLLIPFNIFAYTVFFKGIVSNYDKLLFLESVNIMGKNYNMKFYETKSIDDPDLIFIIEAHYIKELNRIFYTIIAVRHVKGPCLVCFYFYSYPDMLSIVTILALNNNMLFLAPFTTIANLPNEIKKSWNPLNKNIYFEYVQLGQHKTLSEDELKILVKNWFKDKYNIKSFIPFYGINFIKVCTTFYRFGTDYSIFSILNGHIIMREGKYLYLILKSSIFKLSSILILDGKKMKIFRSQD